MDCVAAAYTNHLMAPSTITAKPANAAPANDTCPNSTFGSLDQLALANWATASTARHVNYSGWHTPWLLVWKRLIAGSGWLAIVDWLRRSHINRWLPIINRWLAIINRWVHLRRSHISRWLPISNRWVLLKRSCFFINRRLIFIGVSVVLHSDFSN